MSYIIKNIDQEKGHITVAFSVDNLDQTMGDCPIDSEEATKAFLQAYEERYTAVKTVKLAKVIDPKVLAMVGKVQASLNE